MWGRQSGKTTNGILKLIKKPIIGPRGGHYWHILQTYNAAEIAFNRYVRMFPKSSWSQLWAKKPNESEKKIFLTGFREVSFVSGREYNNLRTETLHGAIIDECREQNPELWTMVIRPMLAKHKGWCDFYSTTNGFDWFYDLYQKALISPDEWGVVHAPSTQAWWWSNEEIESAKKDMSEAQFQQEIMAEFVDIHSGRVYKNFGEHNLTDANPFAPRGLEWSPYLPIVVGMDFNVTPMCWHLGQHKAGKLHWEDRIWLENSDTAEAAEELVTKVRGHSPGLILVGDATGKARKTASAGKTDYTIIHETLKRNGIKFEDLTPEDNPLVKDRVNTMNARFKSASGEVSITINRKLKELIEDCQRVIWKIGSDATIDKRDPKRTHASDSIGYPTCVLLALKELGDIAGRWIKRA